MKTIRTITRTSLIQTATNLFQVTVNGFPVFSAKSRFVADQMFEELTAK